MCFDVKVYFCWVVEKKKKKDEWKGRRKDVYVSVDDDVIRDEKKLTV